MRRVGLQFAAGDGDGADGAGLGGDVQRPENAGRRPSGEGGGALAADRHRPVDQQRVAADVDGSARAGGVGDRQAAGGCRCRRPARGRPGRRRRRVVPPRTWSSSLPLTVTWAVRAGHRPSVSEPAVAPPSLTVSSACAPPLATISVPVDLDEPPVWVNRAVPSRRGRRCADGERAGRRRGSYRPTTFGRKPTSRYLGGERPVGLRDLAVERVPMSAGGGRGGVGDGDRAAGGRAAPTRWPTEELSTDGAAAGLDERSRRRAAAMMVRAGDVRVSRRCNRVDAGAVDAECAGQWSVTVPPVWLIGAGGEGLLADDDAAVSADGDRPAGDVQRAGAGRSRRRRCRSVAGGSRRRS